MTDYTEADFGDLSWHDCHIWGMRFDVGGADGDWTSDLVFDIDFIVEWLGADQDGRFLFRVARATLAFHGVTDPRVDIDWGDSGFRTALHPVSIESIQRRAIEDQKVFLDRPYFSWLIRLNWPAGGEIAFGAVGFTQTLLSEPLTLDTQNLPGATRRSSWPANGDANGR